MEIPEFLTLDDLANIEEYDTSSYNFKNAITNPQTSSDVLDALADMPLYYTLNTAIADSRNVSHGTLHKLAAKARHRWEWRAIYAGFRRNIPNINSYDKDTPYAASIVNSKLVEPIDAAAYFCQTGQSITEDLWHDLATRKIIELGYESDSIDGDHFGPIYEDKVRGFEAHTAAEYLLSPGYFCSWIEQVPDPDHSYIESLMLEEFDMNGDDLAEIFSDRIGDPYPTLMSAAYGLFNKHLEIVNRDAYTSMMIEAMEDYSPDQLDKSVEIISEPDHLNGPRYVQLSDAQKETLTANLILASSHYVHLYFKTTAHLLNLLLLHPDTPESARKEILDAEVPGTEWTLGTLNGEN